MTAGAIRTGIGGWTYEPWRSTFYPADLPKAKELDYAVNHLATIEINGTFYRTQSPATFAKWRDAAPDGFVYAVKALQYCVAKKKLAEAGESIGKFLNSGLSELGDKLGPILWQFRPTRQFDADDMAAFFAMLPDKIDGVRTRHAVEVRHQSFACPEFVALARQHGVAIVVADHDEHPQVADLTADFVYARLMKSDEQVETGYAAADLDQWAAIAQSWAAGQAPEALTYVTPDKAPAQSRDVFAYFISGAKERNPAAAMALAKRLTARD
ncbi:uncharacterized protein YecE (DUF72 family) [Sphingobium sp. B1D7B]|uniref:DUF72 domain-containing protein n=1 Tax=unclassified Sphingobium TaxID=2611147 RepID=UPI00222563BA|nr:MULTISPECIES: DUF72 domain-containing protein [unclassified Sphingobium]MCW2391676.1 uncharacterized protein YecE (DUF72 family) [Sphingobium sp. B11D3A]MCW2403431.1 uncharacterized protein YecE (DUF72 family) [Sphingobium sp. B1D7B]